MDSPRFSDRSSAQTHTSSPRFTEHIHNSPPYQPYPRYEQDSPGIPQYVEGHYGHRSSNKESPYFSQIPSPGLESVMADEGDKEVAPHRWSRPDALPQTWHHQNDRRDERRDRTVCGLSLFWFCILIASIIAIAVGVGIGLGLGLKDTSSGPPQEAGSPEEPESPVDVQYMIGGAINPNYYSSTGAFNGSGIALASQSFAGAGEDATHGSLVMYFQHHSGDIRYVQLSEEGEWQGGSTSEVVASNAKNNTPLSAVSYSVGGENFWHIFYIDQDSYLRQRSNSNETNVWIDGTINDLNLKVYSADQVGMQACWYGSTYGDSHYVHTPLPGGQSGTAAVEAANTGMHMWFASDETTFQQYGWRYGDTEWLLQEVWENKNGHAGVACYSWAEDSSTTYAMFVNTENTVEIWWRDTNLNHTATAAHPLNKWTNTSVAINGANPATSLGFTNYFYWQDAETNMINGYNISWAAENTTFVGDPFMVDGVPGISGTHLSVSALPDAGGGNTLTVFFQVEGDDITEYTRDFIAGQWTSISIPIEDA